MKRTFMKLAWKPNAQLCLLALLLLGTGGCMRGCTSSRPPIHPNPNMDQQPKYRAQAASDFFYDGSTMRAPVPFAVARGELREDSAFELGRDASGEYIASHPLETNEELLRWGQERYGIYCTPCHGQRGNGRGMLYERGGVEATDLHEQRIKDMPDGQFFDVITNGLGLMSGYKYPIPPHDRWAIIAYVREIQRESG